MGNNLLKKIYLSSLKFLVPLTPEKTYATIVNEAVKLVNAEWGSILLEQNGALKRVFSTIPLSSQTIPRKRGFLYKAFKSGKPTILNIRKVEKVHPKLKELSLASDVIIPLSYKKRSIGIIAILSKKEKPITDEVINTLALFGSMASLAIQKSQLYNQAQKALESRNFFISAASHEIKTPVTTIFGYSQLLYQNAKEGRNCKPAWIESLQAECYRLKSLINDFLETSRLSTGLLHYNLKECNFKNLTERVISNFRMNYPERELVLKDSLKSDNYTLIGDFDRLLQALINILDNAAKFSPSDSKILLSLKSDVSELIIKVADSGKGISKKELPRVFEQYFQGTGNQHEGLGLGLFLVKSIIEFHHGRIRLNSTLNKGTNVEIRLPRIKI